MDDMQINYTFADEVDTVHTFTVQLNDGRLVEIYDNGAIKVYAPDGVALGETHVDFAVTF